MAVLYIVHVHVDINFCAVVFSPFGGRGFSPFGGCGGSPGVYPWRTLTPLSSPPASL